MKTNRATHRAGGLMAVLLMAAGTAASTAQDAKLEARPLTHQDIHDYGLPEGTQASGGIHALGLGQPAYLEALVGIDVTGITGVAWAITQQPPGATDALETSPLTPAVPIYEPKTREEYQLAGRSMLRPSVEGRYIVMATVTADGGPFVVTLDLTAASYMGVDTCKLCHSGSAVAPDKWTSWSMTDHATFFTEAIDGIKSSHYNSGCIDCHVVGYDTNPLAVNGGFDDVAAGLVPPWTFPETLEPGNWDAMDPELQNLANIQCENCHGAGSQHVLEAAFGDPDVSKDFIHVNYSSGDCAQCHSEEPYHVFPLQWENSKHAVGYQRASSSCASCHNGIGAIDSMKGETVRKDLGSINCATCHDPHDASNPHQIRSLADVTLKDVSAPGGATVITDGGNGKLCMQCHISRRDAVTYVETDTPGGHFGPHHGPQTDMFVGANAITYGKDIPSSSAHKKLEDSCVLCHMQETDRTSPEHLLAGGHTWEMSWDDMGSKTDLVGACVECHGEIEDFDFQQQDYDGNGIVDGVQTEIKGLLSQVAIMLPPVGVPKPDHSAHNLDIGNGPGAERDPSPYYWSRKQLKAAYNYLFVVEDGSWGAHNTSYAVGLLEASIEDLSTDDNGDGIADWWQEAYFGQDWASNSDSGPNASPAGDDVPNWLKYTMNLDPMVPGAALPDGWLLQCGTVTDGEEVESIRIFTAAEVVFPTEVGMQYQIQATSSLGGGWVDVGDPIPGTGADYSYLTSTRVTAAEFYRVVESPVAP